MQGTRVIQEAIESTCKEDKVAKYFEDAAKMIRLGKFSSTDMGQTLIKLSFEKMSNKLKEYRESPLRGTAATDRNLLFELSDNPDVLAFTTISRIIDKIAKYKKTSLTSMAYNIASRLVQNASVEMVKENNPKLYSYLHHVFKGASAERLGTILKDHATDLYDLTYDNGVLVRIGTQLIQILELSGANLIEIGRESGKNGKGAHLVVRLTADAVKTLTKFNESIDLLAAVNIPPMVIPPKDWSESSNGGYLTHKIPLIKRTNKPPYPDLKRFMGVINKMQQVPWRVNTRVLDVIHDVMELELLDPNAPSNLPRLVGGLPKGDPPNVEEIIRKESFGEVSGEGRFTDKQDYFRYNRAKEETQVKLDAEASRRLYLHYAISIAQDVIDYDEIYFVYQVDYRGRIYCHNNFLNPQGPSYIKAMLEFAEGEVLNDTGMYWLKVHIANEYGHDKLPYTERVKWVEDNLQLILEVAKEPLDYTAFWSVADKPYEFLASCFALSDAVEGKPVHVGVQLDATCSGIQVYSGLLFDQEGAEAVNVVGDSRQDVYQKVADRVNEYLETGDYPKTYTFKDKEGVERTVSTKVEARSLLGKVTRKLTKRNTMTVPYSVTLRGMYDQLREEFSDAKLRGKIFWEGDEWVATKLLADLNYKAIYEVVKGARLGQDYLKEVGKSLSDYNSGIIYKTPFYNFPVRQIAYRSKKKIVKTYFGRLVLRNPTDRIDSRAQVNGIAPNVIHSLDATLLYLTVEKADGPIGTNHDCFTVPANQAGNLLDNFRASYVELMESKPLEYIGQQLNPEVEVPYIGTLDLEDVREAQYIIS